MRSGRVPCGAPDLAMPGITSPSKVPLRLAAMMGFAASLLSFGIGFVCLLDKLIFWRRFALGIAPLFPAHTARIRTLMRSDARRMQLADACLVRNWQSFFYHGSSKP